MELSKIITARAVWLFDIEELNPRGRRVEPILEQLKSRYKFAEATRDEATKGFIFKKGAILSYPGGDGLPFEIEIDSLEVYSDGVVANTRSDTIDSDMLLSDVFNWLWTECSLGSRDFGDRTKKFYVSEVVVLCPAIRLDSGVGSLLMAKPLIAEGTGQSLDTIEIQAITFGSSEKRNLLSLERRIKEPFGSNKYFSTATMSTAKHLRCLESLEKILSC